MVGAMSCNPAIGGVAKGRSSARSTLWAVRWALHRRHRIQFRMLNRAKGPAMHSPRAQADKKAYQFSDEAGRRGDGGAVAAAEVVEGLRASAEGPGPRAREEEEPQGSGRPLSVRVRAGLSIVQRP